MCCAPMRHITLITDTLGHLVNKISIRALCTLYDKKKIYNTRHPPVGSPIVYCPKNQLKAFTLIELLVTLSVLSILLMFAVPSFNNMLLNNRLNANSDTLVKTFNYARSTALNNAMNVRICPLGQLNSTTCGTDWSAGWIVITQPATGTDTLIQSTQNGVSGSTVTANVANVTFDSHGLATAQSNFRLCDNRGAAFGKSVEVMATGFVQAGNTPGQAVWNNSSLVCP